MNTIFKSYVITYNTSALSVLIYEQQIMILQNYLQQCGFSQKEQQLYIALSELGIQPASVVAKKCKLDRVTAYKNMKKLVDRGFVKMYYRKGVQCFGIESFDRIYQFVEEQNKKYGHLEEEFPLFEKMLQSKRCEENIIPKLQIFEGESGLKAFFRDILYELKTEKLRQIRMLTSNTFDEQLGDVSLSKYVNSFFQDLQKEKIEQEIFEASGNLIPERLQRISVFDFDPEKLPASRGTTNIFIVGDAVYLACFKNSPVGLKIKQAEMSQMFHFLFDFMGKKV